MSYNSEFVAILAVACIAIGILIGLAIAVCYKKVACVLSTNNEVPVDTRRDSQFILTPNYSARSPGSNRINPNIDHQFYLSASGASRDNLGFSDDQRRNLRVRANSEPANNSNYLNRKTGYLSKSAGDYAGSRKSSGGIRPLQGGSGCNISGINIAEGVEAGSERDKEEGRKGFHSLWGKTVSGAAALGLPPMVESGEGREYEAESCDDFNDATFVKMLACCPQDIRTIFDPCDFSRMIDVREKKVVYICRKLDNRGGLLELNSMGISLEVPPDAIPYNQRSLVSLVLNWDLLDNPYMDKKEALVSPVVYCGPHGTTFAKPCFLRFKHCAFDTRYARILTSQTDLFDDKDWQDLDPVTEGWGEEEDEEAEVARGQKGVSLTVNECQIEVSHFSLFTCVMRSKSRLLRKWVQVAVFTHDIEPGRKHQQIRIYFLNKTPCALQWAIQREAQHDFTLACPDTTFLFLESGENMMIHLSYLSEGWEAVTKSHEEEACRCILFEEIWHGTCPHASLCFKRVNDGRNNSNVPEPDGVVVVDETGQRLVGSGRSTGASSEASKQNELDCSEINVSLKLKQELSYNLDSVPLEVLAHSFKVKICDEHVDVIHEEGSG